MPLRTPPLTFCFLLALMGLSGTWSAAAQQPQVSLRPSSVQPGDTFVITVAPEAGAEIREIQASFLGVRPKFYPYRGVFKALQPVPSGARPGTHSLYLKVDYADGSTWGTTVAVTLTARPFPRSYIQGMPAAKKKYMDPELLRQEREKLSAALENSVPKPLWEGPFQVPVKYTRVSSEFGRIRYVDGRFWGQHSGVDLAAAAGTPVHAPNHGRIVLAERLEMRGGTLVIDHGFNVFTEFNHLSALLVRVGDEVKKGELVGRVGSTGFATGPHLHWGLRIGPTPVRPWNFIERAVPLD